MAIDLGIEDAADDVAEHLQDGTCVLFLGAAVHSPPPPESRFAYPDELRPLSARALSRALAVRCHLARRYEWENPEDLQRVSLFYEMGRSRSDLIQAVKASVEAGKQPSRALQALAELDFKIVITTNYDTLFEQALRRVGKEPRVYVYPRHAGLEEALGELSPQHPILLKLHGDVGQPETIVITDEDYIEFIAKMTEKEPGHPFPLPLRDMLITWMTLFVGYSLADYNLRLIFRTLRWRTDPSLVSRMYAVDRNPDALIRDVWENERRYLRYVVDDVWNFVPVLYQNVLGKELRP